TNDSNGLGSSKDCQIASEDAPADPAVKAPKPMSKTATKAVSTFQDTDATFHPGVPVPSLHEPGLVFMVQTGFGTIATFGEDHSLHTQIVSQLFIRFGEEAAIAAGLVW